MFEALSDRLTDIFQGLRSKGTLTERDVETAMREIRMSLLEADVNFKVARDFIERVRAKSIGQEVIQSIQPGQQIIKIIHDELVDLLGSENAGLQLSGNPSCVLMVGLHGSGKTTSSGKLGRLLLKQGRTSPHWGGPLADGKLLEDDCVACPWHGSQFSMRDGSVRMGPATVPAHVFEVRVYQGNVEVSRRT